MPRLKFSSQICLSVSHRQTLTSTDIAIFHREKVARLLPPEFWDNTLSVNFIEKSSLQGTDMFCLLISNLCHFLCLSEECCILRTNYSGRHPVPCECSEMHCCHCCSELKITEHRRTRQSSKGSHVTPPCCLFISAQFR